MQSVLICDDDKDIVEAISIYLSGEGYDIIKAYNGQEALEQIDKNDIKLVIMDIMMPVMDGMVALTKIRQISNVPVIMLTAKSEDMDKVLGLNIGADDYVTKPFNPVELIARVKAQLRRYTSLGSVKAVEEDEIILGDIRINDSSKRVTVGDEEISLTPTEYYILRLFAKNPGKVFSPKEIYRLIWDDAPMGSEGTVAVHIRHLREKIEITPSSPRYIKVVWGQGYMVEKE